PLPGALLHFHRTDSINGPDGQPVPVSGANSRDDGTFAISTYEPEDGLPEGDYQVTVSCENRAAKKVKDEYPELLPARYQIPEKSGLKISIAPGSNQLQPLELTR